jgi:hypothetical protein
MRRRISAKTSAARFNRIFREPTALDRLYAKQKDETSPRGFFRLWMCPDTMDLESDKGRGAREELIRLAGECYR